MIFESCLKALNQVKNAPLVTHTDAEQLLTKLPLTVPPFLAFGAIGHLTKIKALGLRMQGSAMLRYGLAMGLVQPSIDAAQPGSPPINDPRQLDPWWAAAQHAIHLWAESFSLPAQDNLDHYLSSIADLRARLFVVVLLLRGGIPIKSKTVDLVMDRRHRTLWVDFLLHRCAHAEWSIQSALPASLIKRKAVQKLSQAICNLQETIKDHHRAWESSETLESLKNLLSSCMADPLSLDEVNALMSDPVVAFEQTRSQLDSARIRGSLVDGNPARLVPRFVLAANT
jgi:hypothetical protein